MEQLQSPGQLAIGLITNQKADQLNRYLSLHIIIVSYAKYKKKIYTIDPLFFLLV